MAETSSQTPKRKRDSDLLISPISFNFGLYQTAPTRGQSPCKIVTHRFRGLAISTKGGVDEATAAAPNAIDDNKAVAADEADVSMPVSKKRMKSDAAVTHDDFELRFRERNQMAAKENAKVTVTNIDAHSPSSTVIITEMKPNTTATTYQPHEDDNGTLHTATSADAPNLSATSQPDISPKELLTPDLPTGPLQGSYPSINRLSDSKSRGRKKHRVPSSQRRGPEARQKPRLKSSQPDDSSFSLSSSPEPEIVDPVRAALTWHEDEITIYDPDDPNDDGTGVNGVGFKPSPAQMHARVVKRRQQLAEYRKREESDARAKRSMMRRRDRNVSREDGGSGGGDERKVRFSGAATVRIL